MNGNAVAEVKRVRLDAGQSLSRFESRYTPARVGGTDHGHRPQARGRRAQGREHAARAGAVVGADPEGRGGDRGPEGLRAHARGRQASARARRAPENVATYWTGGAWDKSGVVADLAAWKTYVDDFARGLQAPIRVSVTP